MRRSVESAQFTSRAPCAATAMALSPDNLRSIEKYRRKAAVYDASAGPTWPIRLRCI